jgi:hypothetical protein
MNRSTLLAVLCGAVLLLLVLPRGAAADEPGAPAVTGDSSSHSPDTGDDPPGSQNKRIFGIIPNNRTSEQKEHQPLTPREKFALAAEDSFDWGTYILAGAFAGYGQLRNATPAFGHGVTGYARYWTAAYGDQAIGNLMTEAVYPVILHQDPRYFRRGTGSGWSRLGYAAGQIFVIRSDSGAIRFNFSEVVGNLTAVGISEAYYPDNRDVPHAASKLGIQIGTDMAGNILKEFWPDLSEAFSRTFHAKAP